MEKKLETHLIFPAPITGCIGPIALWENEPIYPEEEELVRHAVPRRKREFSAGRACARRALAKLGIPPGPIPRMDERRPRWPKGIIGSISHSRTWCGAAVSRAEDIAGLGLDIEETTRMNREIARRVLLPEEWERSSGNDEQLEWALIFSAKEAFYKAAWPIVKRYIPFQEVVVEKQRNNTLTFRGLSSDLDFPGLTGRFVFHADHVISGVVIPSPQK